MKRKNFLKRRKRVRARIFATTERPRLSVFRSNKFIYAQIIHDSYGTTLVAASEKDLKVEEKNGLTKMQKARKVGLLLSKKAAAAKIRKVTFDRGAYKYHGRVKALAEGAREGGLEF